MSVLVYAPQVQLVVASDWGYIDCSQDIVSGQVTLAENQSHQMSCVLMNKGRRYDKLFKPNDRFAIYMKRLTNLLVMTGYLDSVPFYSKWGRSIQISGSSTLKRLQYHFWDPGTAAAVSLFNLDGNGTISANQPGSGDALLVNKAMALLTQVANWDLDKIHFASLPSGWVTKMDSLARSVFPEIGLSYQTGMPVFNGATPFTSGVTTQDQTLANMPNGAALPYVFGAATPYQGPQDIQSLSSYYCQMQWGYQNPDGSVPANISSTDVKSYLSKQKLMVGSPDTGQSVIVEIAGWGPPTSTQAVIGLSSDVLSLLAIPKGGQVQIAWVVDPTNVGIGPYSAANKSGVTSPTNVMPSDIGKIASITGISPGQQAPVQFNNSAGNTSESPEAQAAVNFAQNQLGKPYQWGGTGPLNYDCSGLCLAAWSAAGAQIARDTVTQFNTLAPLPNDPTTWLPGDMVFYGGGPPSDYYDGTPTAPGHVKLYVGNNETIEALHPGTSVMRLPLDMSYVGARRVTAGTSTAVSPTANAASGISVSSSGNTISASSFLSLWAWISNQADPASASLTGYRSLLNDVPLLPTIQQVINASMRSFCSAPNGDLIAWFPDYFNVYNTLSVIQVQDIEVQDFTIQWSDLNLVTHQFAAGTYTPLAVGSQIGGLTNIANEITTGGVATIDFPALIEAVLNVDPNDPTFTTDGIYQRFGARPNFQSLGVTFGPQSEFWLAVYLFQRNWASQFAAQVPLTFLPELYPGMIMQLPPNPDDPSSEGFQCYVQQVTHTWDLHEGGGFQTQAVVTAPSALGNQGFYGLAKGGNWSP